MTRAPLWRRVLAELVGGGQQSEAARLRARERHLFARNCDLVEMVNEAVRERDEARSVARRAWRGQTHPEGEPAWLTAEPYAVPGQRDAQGASGD